MSVCAKCVYSGYCLLELSSVPVNCNMYHDKKELGMTEEQRIDLEYLHRSSKQRTDPEFLRKVEENLRPIREEEERRAARNEWANRVAERWLMVLAVPTILLSMAIYYVSCKYPY